MYIVETYEPFNPASLRALGAKRRSALVSGGGTADQLTGSLLTNLMILETMLSSDFLSDLSLSSYGCIA